MKRHTFRLGTVLKYYVLQKQRTEYELHEASRLLRETEAEIMLLQNQLTAVAALLHGTSVAPLTMPGWMACYQNAEKLDQCLTAAATRLRGQREKVGH